MPSVATRRAPQPARLDALGVSHLGFDLSQIDPKQLDALIDDIGEIVMDPNEGRAGRDQL